jgi:hypothetical protein
VSAVPDLPFSLNVSVQPVVRHVTKALTATGFNESARCAEPEKIAQSNALNPKRAIRNDECLMTNA